MTKQTMGEFLSVLRKSHGYTQQEVAEKLNVSNKTLSSWETDRTTPDILLLPAIADLYGVTVDELVRGVRGNTDEVENKTAFTENALHSSRKHRYGKFTSNSIILTGAGCFCAALFAVTFILNLFLNTPLWLDLLLWILSAGGVIACGIVLSAFKHNLMVKEGIVLSEDYTQENKAYAFTVNRKVVNFLLLCALPLLLEAFVILCVFIPKLFIDYDYVFDFIDLSETYRNIVISAYLTAILPTAIIGAGMITAYIVFNCVSFKRFANDEQKDVFKNNRKLLLKILIFAIPVIAINTFFLIFSYLTDLMDKIFEYAPYICDTVYVLTLLICLIIYTVRRKTISYDFK